MKNLKNFDLQFLDLTELNHINGGSTNPEVYSEPGNEGCEVDNPLNHILEKMHP